MEAPINTLERTGGEAVDADFFLIQKMKQGDEAAVEKFVKKYYPVILKYCSYHTWDREDAADLTQETFMRFFTSLTRYQHRGKAVHYLYVIAGNLCRDFFHGHPELPVEEVELEVFSEPADNPIEQVEEKLQIEGALKRLPGELQEVLILYYFQNLKLKEIAEVLQIGLPLVKYRIGRAKKEMKNYLEEEDDT